LEEGFEAKVLALPGGLDPDSFIRKQGVASYRDRLAAAPSYIDYLTDRAAAKNDLSKPEGKVAAANAVLPFLTKIPNAMLRAELTNRVAERLHLDERLLREELRRAAGEGRREIKMPATPHTSKANPAERHLLKAFMENDELADEFLAKLIGEGDVSGLATEGLFKQILDARSQAEKFDITKLEDSLSPEDRRLVYELLMSPMESSGRDEVLSCTRALRRRRLEHDGEKLQAAIQAAERAKDAARVGELLQAKARLAKELAQLRGA
jgi:DNA primase